MESEHEEHFPNYLLVWIVLLLLTATSIIGSILVKELSPEKWLETIEMFLLAFLFILGVVKASLVVANFMHLRFEPKFIWVLGLIGILFVGFFMAGTFFDLTLTEKI